MKHTVAWGSPRGIVSITTQNDLYVQVQQIN